MSTFAVIDVETTGLNPYCHDRIVEVAVVLMNPGEEIINEFSTIVNPERDIGPTSIHGLRATDVINAPRFYEIAGTLINVLRRSTALVGHNVRFDYSFLLSEFTRLGVEMPSCTLIDTQTLTGGGTLSACCAEYGVRYEGRLHAALHDARATTSLLEQILST